MEINEEQFAKYWGKGVESMFPPGSSPVQTVPWPRAGRMKNVSDYDLPTVQGLMRNPAQPVPIDPRTIQASQPSVTLPGVSHYAENSDWATTGETYADADRPSNRFPIVYDRHPNWPERSDNPDRLLLSGHHRAAAALVNGEQFPALYAEGGWGPPR